MPGVGEPDPAAVGFEQFNARPIGKSTLSCCDTADGVMCSAAATAPTRPLVGELPQPAACALPYANVTADSDLLWSAFTGSGCQPGPLAT